MMASGGHKRESDADGATYDLTYTFDTSNDHDDTSNVESTKLLCNQKSCSDDSILLVEETFVVYKQRWLMFMIFLLNTALNRYIFVMFSPINDIDQKYYNVSSTAIYWLPNMFLITYVVLTLPATFAISRWGIRPVIFFAATLNLAATVFHFVGYKERFSLVVVGQVFSAIAYSTILQMPAKLSVLWFPKHERATVASICMTMNMFGMGVGLKVPSALIRTDTIENDIKMLSKGYFLLAFVILVLTIFYEEKPPKPPSTAATSEHPTFFKSLRLVVGKELVVLSLSYAISFGVFHAAYPMVTSRLPVGYEPYIGWMAVWSIIVALVASLVFGRLLDRFQKFKLTVILITTVATLLWIIYILVLNNTESFVAVYVSFLLLGTCYLQHFAVGVEMASEMTYPVSGEVSSSMLCFMSYLCCFLFTFVFGALVDHRLTGYVMVGFLLLMTSWAAFVKIDVKRLGNIVC